MAEVAIVGAGVIGLAVARELGRAGLADVVVLEREAAVARGSTSRANGGFRAQFTTRPNVEFSRFSIDELERLEAETGLCSLRQVGYLLMTGTEPGERALRAAYELQRSLGVPTEWLTPEGVLAKAMHAPAAGRAVAELITLGRCETFDLHPLRPERLAEGDLVVEAAVL